MPNLLDAKQVKAALKDFPEWELEKTSIERVFEFDDFSAAIDFVNGIAELAEEHDHHPDIDIRWRKVTLRFVTHDAGNRVTEQDTRLAAECDLIFSAL